MATEGEEDGSRGVNMETEGANGSTGGGMAYEFERIEREEGGGSFLMGLLAGTVLGAGLGMLFAPKSGSELRNQLTEQAGKLRTSANDTYHQASDKVSKIMDRGREAYDRALGGVATMASGTTTGGSTVPGSESTGAPSYSTPGSSNRM
jgi:gas vesicle protein